MQREKEEDRAVIGDKDKEWNDENVANMEHANLFLKLHPGSVSKDIKKLIANFDRVNKHINEK